MTDEPETCSDCASCPYMRPGSSFDGKHLYCEHEHVWTNLLAPKWRGQCLIDLHDHKPAQLQLQLKLDI